MVSRAGPAALPAAALPAAALVSVVALAIAAAACTQSVPTNAPSPDRSSSIPAAAADLAAVLFDEVPPGYVADPEATRPLTLDEAIEGADDPDEMRTRLRQEQFVAGYARLWVSDDDSTNVIFAYVYEFARAEGAKAEQDSGIAEARRDNNAMFDVIQIAGAIGVTQSAPPDGEGDDSTFHAISFVRGTRYYLVAVGGVQEPATQDAIDLAIAMDAVAR